jgi:hypothetical protein
LECPVTPVLEYNLHRTVEGTTRYNCTAHSNEFDCELSRVEQGKNTKHVDRRCNLPARRAMRQ